MNTIHLEKAQNAWFFMGALEKAVRECGFTPVYAFSKRESEEIPQPDGSVRKVQVFRHCGFVEV